MTDRSAIDYVGQTVGGARILERAGYVGRNRAWRARCACGEEFTANSAYIHRVRKRGGTLPCPSCLRAIRARNGRSTGRANAGCVRSCAGGERSSRVKDLAGLRLGGAEVLRWEGIRRLAPKSTIATWVVRCACGREFVATSTRLHCAKKRGGTVCCASCARLGRARGRRAGSQCGYDSRVEDVELACDVGVGDDFVALD